VPALLIQRRVLRRLTPVKRNLPLDHTSTSPNFGLVLPPHIVSKKDDLPSPKCTYANIWFAYQIQGKHYGISQGCCNHWDCPRCGQLRAKQEYARIVHGVHELSVAGYDLYFQTITCRGKTLTHKEADQGYLGWTNRLLDAYRARVKSKGGHWAYVQVTERQRRGHPHSHFLTTFAPRDESMGTITKWRKRGGGLYSEEIPALRSNWLRRAVSRSGLGEQYDISTVRDEQAASRYVAKYLFKPSAFDAGWPAGWRRVRYSQSFPKLPELKTDAFVLLKWQDWDYLARLAVSVSCGDEETFEYAQWKLYTSDVLVMRRKALITQISQNGCVS